MKKKLALVLILSSVLFLTSKSYSKELINKTDRKMQELFAAHIENQYKKEFKYNIQTYNSKSYSVGHIATTRKNFPEYEAYAGLKLPKINVVNDEALIKVGGHKITFNTKSLFEGFIDINGKKINIRNISDADINMAIRQAKKTSFFHSILDSLIHRAQAQDQFEVLIFSTVIAVNYEFNTSWCFFESCDQQKGRRNLDIVMREINKQAQDCELYGIEPSILSDLADFTSSQNMKDDLSEKLEDAFNNYSANELTCQRFVENYHQEEIKQRTSRIEVKGYGGELSFRAAENRIKNDVDFNAYVTQICQPFVDLRNCLVKEHRQAQAIHDNARGAGKEKAWKQYDQAYQPEPRTGASQR